MTADRPDAGEVPQRQASPQPRDTAVILRVTATPLGPWLGGLGDEASMRCRSLLVGDAPRVGRSPR
jgi:hypothetical protein